MRPQLTKMTPKSIPKTSDKVPELEKVEKLLVRKLYVYRLKQTPM